MPDGYSRRTVLRGAAGAAGALALPGRDDDHEDRGLTDQDRAAFLAAQDPVWSRMPRTWYEGPFLGNGFLGSMLYAEPAANALRFTVQHSEVQDHRPQVQGNDWGVARLPVGHLTLEPVGRITGVQLRLHLWDAEVRGTVTTDKGHIRLRAIVQNDRSLLLVTAETTKGERDFTWVFHPEKALSPRIVREPPPPALTPNPDPVTSTVDGATLVVQPMVAGGQTATAYREVTAHDERTLYLTVAHTFPDTTAQDRVLDTVRRATQAGKRRLVDTHRDWWHGYYRKSFLSIPDGMLQSFYWIQLYKVASAARREAPVMATTGPWLEPTPWPGVWWNLNVQLEYWLIHGSNHLELDAIPRTLLDNQQILIDGLRPEYRADSAGLRRSTDQHGDDNGFVAVPNVTSPAPEVGDLPWALHNVWLSYRHTMDVRLLRDVLFPLLRRAMNYYLHFLAPGPDGKLHLPPTFSPEYGTAPDCNYDLALIRWSCRTLLDAAKTLGIADPLAPTWQRVLGTLVDYPVDANGFMVGAGVPFAMSHRHYSHMLMVYPLYLVTAEQPEHRALIETSLRHWISFEGALRGYSFTGAASISAQLGKGDDALGYLRELVARFIQPNTMYYEAGPVIETPLSAAQSVHDMLCQSWGGVIRVFPAVPAAWADVTLDDFRTQGAFLVSAVRRNGSTSFVKVHSLAGEPCRVRTGIPGPLTVSGGHARWRTLPNGDVEIDLPRGAEVVIHKRGQGPDLTIAPVRVTTPAPRWGLPPLPPAGPIVTVDLAASFNNDGTSNEFSMRDGDFDGTGRTYPAAQLPQTGHLTADGIEFLFFNGAEGTLNNVVAAGQMIALPQGKYHAIHLIGAADSGNVSIPATLTYADGSTQVVPLQLTGWLADPNYGETVALRTNLVHTPTGALNLQAALFHQKLPADPARDLVSLTLPQPTGARPHIFSLALERGVV
jgi:alpha-L-fucosidase 2